MGIGLRSISINTSLNIIGLATQPNNRLEVKVLLSFVINYERIFHAPVMPPTNSATN
jgi:hypothetical protein